MSKNFDKQNSGAVYRLLDSTSISSVLEKNVTFHSPRPRYRRFIIVALITAVLVTIIVLTKTHSLPKVFPFVMIYAAHDYFYLPLKGHLWTAWYPWSLMLWVPVFGLLFAVAWSWVVGKEPTKIIQKFLTLKLITVRSGQIGDNSHFGALLVGKLVRITYACGLRSDYITTVISNALEECIDSLEATKLSGRDPDELDVKRAIVLLDALFEVYYERQMGKSGPHLAAIFDVAMLSHFNKFSSYLANRARRWISLGHPQKEDVLLRQLLANQSVGACAEQIEDCLKSIETSIIEERSRIGAVPPVKKDTPIIGKLFFNCIFAYYSAPNVNWAMVNTSILMSLDRMWLSQALSNEGDDIAKQTAFWIKRSRLTSIRHFHQASWQTNIRNARKGLWPENSEFHWSMMGAELAAGGRANDL
ncbi:MAG: hypothetical protein ABJO86_13145 [Lentilitoribacter sp.]